MRFTETETRHPKESEQRIIGEDDGAHCDGLKCGVYQEDENGQPIEVGPHHHIVLRGEDPPASPLYYPIFSR
jgi:hypothetical protein